MASFPDRRKFSNFFAAAGHMVGRLMAGWRQWVSPDRYRPEKHYMRGPGPKNAGPKISGPKNPGPKNPGPKNPNKNPKNSGKADSGDSRAA